VIMIEGEIDLYSSVDFQEAAASEFGSGKTHVLLDLSAVEYLDSSGVGCIIRMIQRAKEMHANFAVCGLHGMPLKVLQFSHILTLLKQYPDSNTATEFFRN